MTKRGRSRVMTRVIEAPIESARSAGLRYVTDDKPGIHRERCGRGFRYRDGRKLVRDPATLARIRSLAIPPAWTNVWISSDPSSHVQAVGRDARQHENRSRNRWRLTEESARRCCAPARDDIYPGWATVSTRARTARLD